MKETQVHKRTAARLYVALATFTGERPKDAKGVNAMIGVGRASARKEEAKGFISMNVAQTLNIIRQKVEKVQRLSVSREFVEACRETALSKDIDDTLIFCEKALALWSAHKEAIKTLTKAA
jgi:negative regulator of replication initiation